MNTFGLYGILVTLKNKTHENSQIEGRFLYMSVCLFLDPICFYFLQWYGMLRILPFSPSVFMPISQDICGVDICSAKGV